MPLEPGYLGYPYEQVVSGLELEIGRSWYHQIGDSGSQQVNVLDTRVAVVGRLLSVPIVASFDQNKYQRAQEPFPKVACMYE